jgi:hypothetical protein
VKTRIICVLALAAPLMASAAHADDPKPPFQAAVFDAQEEHWLNCIRHVDLQVHDRDAPVDASTKVQALDHAVGSFAVGATPSGAELRGYCIAQAKAVPTTERLWKEELGINVGDMASEVKDMQAHPYDKSYQTVAQELRGCDNSIALATEILGADTQVTFDVYQQPTWSGTVTQAKAQFCDAARQAVDAQKQKTVEPFTKAGIKNDKLKILEEYNFSVDIGIPGGDWTSEPKALAKANPWFSSANGDDCAGGHVITHLHRYQFDKNQKLVKESTKDYCGEVPKSAFR